MGKVYLVGAGPGDPSLITLRGVQLLRSADVVLYDALSHPALLEHCPQAELRDVGKRFAQRSPPQEVITSQINLVLNENTVDEKRETFIVPLRAIGDLLLVKTFNY